MELKITIAKPFKKMITSMKIEEAKCPMWLIPWHLGMRIKAFQEKV